MEKQSQDFQAYAAEGLASMLEAQRCLGHALRRITELSAFDKGEQLESEQRLLDSLQDQFRRVANEFGDLNDALQNLLEFRRTKDREVQRGVFALDNLRINLAESVATLNMISDYIRDGLVLSRSSLAETRNTADRSRSWSRLGSGLLQDFIESQEQMDQLSQIIKTWDDLLKKNQSLQTEVFGHSQTSRDAIRSVLTVMQNGRDKMGTVREKISILVNRLSDIGNIIDIITDISEQTNLLALNASIEAARAGEQGKGFAVVADDIRKLAERSSTATRDIYDRIDAIHAETNDAMVAIQEGGSIMDAGVKSASMAGELLRELREKIGLMSRQELGLEDELRSAKNLTMSNLSRSREMVRGIRNISETGNFAQELVAHLEGSLVNIVATSTSGLNALQTELKRMMESIEHLEIAQDVIRQIRDWVHGISVSIGDMRAGSEVARSACIGSAYELGIHRQELGTRISALEEMIRAVQDASHYSSDLMLSAELLRHATLSGVRLEMGNVGSVLQLEQDGHFKVVHGESEQPTVETNAETAAAGSESVCPSSGETGESAEGAEVPGMVGVEEAS